MYSFYTRNNVRVSEHTPPLIDNLNAASRKACILVLGPQLAIPSKIKKRNDNIYLRRLLKSMVEWCIQQNDIIEPSITKTLRELATRPSLAHVGKIFEEFLIKEEQLQLCLTEILQHTSRVTQFYQNLVRLPIRGYISTTYDVSVENAYKRLYKCTPPKFYSSSIHEAIHVYQREEQFILKLYGDIKNKESIIFNQRLNRGLDCIDKQDDLRELFSISEVIFLGFEETDSDLQYLTSLLQENQPYKLLSLSQTQGPTRKYKTQWWENNDTTSHSSHSPSTDISLLPGSEIFSTLLASTSSSTHKTRSQEIPLPTYTPQFSPIEIYTAYTQKDEEYYLSLKEQLDILRKQGWPISCHASEITYSTKWKNADNLETANLILLLISATFLNSDFCYGPQLRQAIEQRVTDKRCCFLPIIVRPFSISLLARTPLVNLDFLPTNRKAISTWANYDEAYENITNYILEKLDEIKHYL